MTTHRHTHTLDVRDHLGRALHGLARQPRRDDGAPGDPHRSRRLARAARVDGQRLHADLRGAAPDRRRARRPLRPTARCSPSASASSRSGRPPPRSRRRVEALNVARAVQGLGGAIVMPLTLTLLSAAVPPSSAGSRSAPGAASAGSRSPSGRSSAARSSRGSRGTGSSGSTSRSGSSSSRSRCGASSESRGPAGRLDLPGRRAREHGPLRRSCGASSAGTRRAGRARRSSARSPPAPSSSRRSSPGSSARAAPMLPMRFFRSRSFALANGASFLMFFGMFGSIFLLAQFFHHDPGLLAPPERACGSFRGRSRRCSSHRSPVHCPTGSARG